MLSDLELWPTVGADFLFNRDCLGNTHACCLLRFRLGQGANGSRLLNCPLVVGLTLVALDSNADFRFGQRLLLAGTRLSLAQLALFDRRFLLAIVGLDLLLGNLPRSQLRQDLLDLLVAGRGRWCPNQDLFQFQVVVRELLAHLLTGQTLDDAALLDELDKSPDLPDVFEVCGNHGVKRLLNQSLDITEALDDQGRLSVVDMYDDRQG